MLSGVIIKMQVQAHATHRRIPLPRFCQAFAQHNSWTCASATSGHDSQGTPVDTFGMPKYTGNQCSL